MDSNPFLGKKIGVNQNEKCNGANYMRYLFAEKIPSIKIVLIQYIVPEEGPLKKSSI